VTKGHTEVEVTAYPDCNICCAEAHYDARTRSDSPGRGAWAYLCEPCFERLGVGLGLGSGQRLVVRQQPAT